MTDYKYPLHPYKKISDLKDMMDKSLENYPDNVAFLTKPVKGEPYFPVSYRKYYADVEAAGTMLLELGLGTDSRVAIVAETRYEWYVSYLAGMNGEATMVPIDKELQAEELLSLFNRSYCDAIIYSPEYADRIEGVASQVPTLKHLIIMNDPSFATGKSEEDDPAVAHGGPDKITLEDGSVVPVTLFNDLLREGRRLLSEGDQRFRQVQIDPEAVRVLLFTSGTTDKSKCVMHSHKTICANMMEMGQLLFVGINHDDTVLSVLPLNHTYECTCGFLYQIYVGDTIAQVEGLRYITDNMKESKVTCILAVPLLLESVHRQVWRNIRKQGKEKLVRRMMSLTRGLKKIGIDVRKKVFGSIHDAFGGHMRTFISGGAAIDPKILEDFYDWGFVAVQGYGLTEFAPILALNRERHFRHDSAGLPLPGNDIKIINPNENGIGEIVGRGANMMLGYYEAPELTAEAIVDGWYHTGDMGYITDDGFLIITGRKKNTIITKNGKNIFPEELEAVLNRNPEIAESVVSAEPRINGDHLIVVEIFPDKEGVEERLGKEASDEQVLDLMKELVKDLNSKIPTYQGIRDVRIRDTEFPKNTSRKILRDYSKKEAI
ncbi:MAG: AMP-binding protein [Eubacteriales bacterium]|nr:AMP-binding protein [Eubacteriales bacterium]MDD4542039.1 AMP-binding protein [Eubacteriales bacterium]